jgi:hypothetical protein
VTQRWRQWVVVRYDELMADEEGSARLQEWFALEGAKKVCACGGGIVVGVGFLACDSSVSVLGGLPRRTAQFPSAAWTVPPPQACCC